MLIRNARRSSTYFFEVLTCLAFSDLGLIICSVTFFGLPMLSEQFGTKVMVPCFHLLYFGLHTFRTMSVYFTVLVNVDRSVAIRWPFLQKKPWTRWATLVIVIFAIAYNIPKFYEMEILHEIVQIRETGNVGLRIKFDSTDFRRSEYYQYYGFWAKFLLVEFVPYFSVVTSNFFTVFAYAKSRAFQRNFQPRASEAKRSCCLLKRIRSGKQDQVQDQSLEQQPQQQQQQQQLQQQQEWRFVLVVIGVSFAFIFCQSFKIVPDCYEIVSCDASTSCIGGNETIQFFVLVSQLLVVTNSSANFIAYHLAGSRFRKDWLEFYGFSLCSESPTMTSTRVPTASAMATTSFIKRTREDTVRSFPRATSAPNVNDVTANNNQRRCKRFRLHPLDAIGANKADSVSCVVEFCNDEDDEPDKIVVITEEENDQLLESSIFDKEIQ